MTVTTGQPRPTNDDIPNILTALQDGRTAQQAADTYGWPRQRVVALINGRRGWLHDPETDRIKVFKVAEPLPAPEPETTMPTPTTPADDKPAEETPEPAAAEPVGIVGLEALLRRAEASEHAATRNAGQKVRTVVEDLRQRINAEAAETRVRTEIAELEKQLAAKQEKLRELRPSKTTARRPASDGPTPKEVRVWAAEQGIECSPNGRVPQAIVDKYLAATAGAR
jgi:hypothetical protein